MAWEKNTFMERIYLFGAGKNGENAIRFWGKENIIAIIDNSINQIGRKINGLSVISLQDCLEKYKGEIIVITSVYYSSEIKKQLDKVDITNVFVCPFFDNNSIDPINIVNNYNLYDYNKIIIEKNNPILYRIADILKESYKETNIEIICSNQLETKETEHHANGQAARIAHEDLPPVLGVPENIVIEERY